MATKSGTDETLIRGILLEIGWHGCRVYLRNGLPCLSGDISAIPDDTRALLKEHRRAIIDTLATWEGPDLGAAQPEGMAA
ncbi:hypothetical protein [Acetobacter sp.]|uniref:hypothetical protein n=1 Tax=Acetobacter sp. TaxID=440 RepID=UPI0039E7FFEB